MSRAKSIHAAEAALFRALAHPVRLQILDILSEGEVCVCHIQAVLRQRQAYVSQHLMALRSAGLVASRKHGLRVYYQISEPHMQTMLGEARQVALAHGSAALPGAGLTLRPNHCKCPRCVENGESVS